AFKREQGLVTVEEPNGAPGTDEIDLREEVDALIAAELDAAEARRSSEPEEAGPDVEADTAKRRQRRQGGRRGGAKGSAPLETTTTTTTTRTRVCAFRDGPCSARQPSEVIRRPPP